MKIIRLTKQIWATALLPVIFVLVAFSSIQDTGGTRASNGKPVVHISQAYVVTVRDHTENAPINPVRNHDFIITNWQRACLQLTTSIRKKGALHIPVNSFHVFYSVVTINAP
ncbi:MAG: hypothetical protein KIT62_02595 [Cyclobacteriaceae bacterium]|nr:hypothetical protein [Cyclobacteriaceae bacterium]